MLKEGLLSTLKGEHILHGIEVMLGKAADKTSASGYLENSSFLFMLEVVLPTIIRLLLRKVRIKSKGRGQKH